MALVLDSSVALAWLFADEKVQAAETALGMVVAAGAWVPAIWRLEVANGLQMGVRRGRIDSRFRDDAIADLALLDISVDAETDNAAWTATLRLADRFRLTLYDACYLELAQRRNLPLASLDRELLAAAANFGLPTIGS